MKSTLSILAVSAVLGLTGCATQAPGSSNYSSYEVGQEQSIRYGVIEQVRYVTLDNQTTGVGTGTGAILGGLAGSQIGHGSGSIAGAVVGAVAGGLVGQNIERNNSRAQGVELTIRLDRGRTIAITQPADQRFYNGQRVKLLGNGNRTIVTGY